VALHSGDVVQLRGQRGVAFLQFVPITLKSLIPKLYDFEPKTLGEYIRKKRLMLGITHKEAGKRLGETHFTVINWESGQNKVSTKLYPSPHRVLGL